MPYCLCLHGVQHKISTSPRQSASGSTTYCEDPELGANDDHCETVLSSCILFCFDDIRPAPCFGDSLCGGADFYSWLVSLCRMESVLLHAEVGNFEEVGR